MQVKSLSRCQPTLKSLKTIIEKFKFTIDKRKSSNELQKLTEICSNLQINVASERPSKKENSGHVIYKYKLLLKTSLYVMVFAIVFIPLSETHHLKANIAKTSQDPVELETLKTSASNHTSFYLDSDTNSTGAAHPSNHMAITGLSRRPFESIVLPLGNRAAADSQRPIEVTFDDDDDNNNDQVAKQLADIHDDDEDAGLGESDDEDEHDFYTRNPVGSIEFKLLDDNDEFEPSSKKSTNKSAAESVHFDDLKALKLDSFYGPKRSLSSRKRKQRHHRIKPIRTISNKNQPLKSRLKQINFGNVTSESQVSEMAPLSTNRDFCALFLDDGRCVSFNSVEWAIRRARKLIDFRPPQRAALQSLEPSEATINQVGELIEWTSRVLAIRFGLTNDEINYKLDQIDVSRTSLWRWCPRLYRLSSANLAQLCASAGLGGRYRTHSGRCNGPLFSQFGASFMPFARLLPADYSDGLGMMRRAQSGNQLPPARLISLNLHPNFEEPAQDLAALFANWGQLINHDLALASGARPATGHEGSCCSRAVLARFSVGPSDSLSRVCAPILIDRQDPVYAPFGVRCHDFKRSIAGLRPGCSLGPRTQVNLVTSFVDASFVYGSSETASNSLRSQNGRLATWNYFGRRRRTRPLKPLLPPQLEAPDDECVGRQRGLFCFRSGDLRTNQQVPLVLLHTYHTRQHNRLADALAALNPHWPGRRLYEEARRIHIAQVQHILISEYLPILLGAKTCNQFNLTETPLGDFLRLSGGGELEAGPEPPAISQEFAAAAFRQGHSSVPSRVFRLDTVSRRPKRFYQLRELFRQPWPLFEAGALDEFALGLLETPAQSVDPFVSLELSGHLLEEPDEPVGLDLVAINIQRGRDQGVASYNSAREWCGLGRLDHFGQLARVMSNASSQLMASLYESVDDIDLYSGGLSEWPLEGAQLGPTFACIVGHQFRALRLGDPRWFEAAPAAFTPDQLVSIKQFSLARLICANSDSLDLIQAAAMQLPHPILNPIVACQALPDIDLSLWLEPAPPVSPAEEEEQEQEQEQDQDEDR